MKSTDAVILCAGKGARAKTAKNKVLCYFGAKTAIEYCLDAFAPFCNSLIVVAAEDDIDEIKEISAPYSATVTVGGATRFLSVLNGLKKATSPTVIIHDAARPFVTKEIIEKCIKSAETHGSGIAATPTVDTIKRVENGMIVKNIKRDGLYNVQTPQAFDTKKIVDAYLKAAENPSSLYTDDSAVFAAYGYAPVIVESDPSNKKITTPQDIIALPPCQKIGNGIDFHRLVPKRKLILGGVEIPNKKGLLGHSDADVLTHAVMDALLSAIGMPDIGVLFPSTEQYKNANSLELLDEVMRYVSEAKYSIMSVSAVVIAKEPKLSPFMTNIRQTLAERMNLELHQINVSATTTEGMGVIGQGDGMAATAVCLLNRTEK